MSKGVGTRDFEHQGQVATTGPDRPAPGKHTVAESQEAASGGGRRTLIVDDASNVPGAMAKEAFLARLRQVVTSETDNAMGAEGASAECPYVEQYFARYASEPAAAVEALIFKWVPFAQNARSAEGLIPLVSARVRSGVAAWRASGTLPADLAAADPAFAAQAEAASNPAGAMTIDSLEAQLGGGRPVDASTAARMGSVVGADVSAARIHEGPQAAALASQHAATAFAVGPNVVLGANVPEVGSLEYDALLAHELAHTAQQKDAAANPAERRKPIGAEDAAAEHDAGAERLARLGNFAGQVGDVMRTGLQLQRCPNTQKLPPGPPMAGKEADAAIASIPMIRQRIGDDLAKGINAENRTKFHATMDTYVKAWKEESLLVPSIWQPNLSSAQLEKLRWEAAREKAATAPGFTNFQTDVIHIYTPGTPAFVTIHELIHLHTQNQVYSTMGENFVEGVADYFTEMACTKNQIPFVAVYSKQTEAVRALASAVTDEALAGLVFKGDEKSVEQIVDSKGQGTWKKYKAALAAGDYKEAKDLLAGVHDANAKRVAKEDAAVDAQQKADETQGREEKSRKIDSERKNWPPEGTQPMSGRVIKVDASDSKSYATVGHGGGHGVREGWKARAKLVNGFNIDGVVVEVMTRSSKVEFATPQAAAEIDGNVELRPASSR